MPLPNVEGLRVYCRACSTPFTLGSLNARRIDAGKEEFVGIGDIGWICRCDHCGRELEYNRKDFF
jgi:RNase P subunit RPR2